MQPDDHDHDITVLMSVDDVYVHHRDEDGGVRGGASGVDDG